MDPTTSISPPSLPALSTKLQTLSPKVPCPFLTRDEFYNVILSHIQFPHSSFGFWYPNPTMASTRLAASMNLHCCRPHFVRPYKMHRRFMHFIPPSPHPSLPLPHISGFTSPLSSENFSQTSWYKNCHSPGGTFQPYSPTLSYSSYLPTPPGMRLAKDFNIFYSFPFSNKTYYDKDFIASLDLMCCNPRAHYVPKPHSSRKCFTMPNNSITHTDPQNSQVCSQDTFAEKELSFFTPMNYLDSSDSPPSKRSKLSDH
jgi:hypothetical protein